MFVGVEFAALMMPGNSVDTLVQLAKVGLFHQKVRAVLLEASEFQDLADFLVFYKFSDFGV